MTSNEKLLQLLTKAMEENNEGIKEGLLKNIQSALCDNIREEVAKSKGNKKPLQVVKKIVTSKEVEYRPDLGKYHPFSFSDKEYKGFTNGYYVIASMDDFGYEESEHPIKMNQFFEDAKTDLEHEFTIDMTDLKAFIKIHKKDNEPYILIDNDYKIAFNPEYLLNVLSFTDSNKLYTKGHNLSAGYCYNENKDYIALILPIKINY